MNILKQPKSNICGLLGLASKLGFNKIELRELSETIEERKISRLLTLARTKSNVSGYEMAKKLGISLTKLINIENSTKKKLTFSTVEKYLDVLGYQMEYTIIKKG